MEQVKKRFCVLGYSLLAILIVAFIVLALKLHGYWLTYQVTASMPKGWYVITPAKKLVRNEVVVFKPPKYVKQFLVAHHWLPNNGVMMKEVMAVPGDHVCRQSHAIWINHHRVAPVYHDYAPGKSLPGQKFCGVLKKNQYLLMSTHVPRSFDGRYFGSVNKKKILGVAHRV